MSRLSILYVVSHWPGAPPYGAQQRTLHIGRLLQKLGDVSLVVVNAHADGERWRRQTEAEFKIARVIDVKPVAAGGIVERLRHEFDPGYLTMTPFAADPKDRFAILDLLGRHDAAWVFGLKTVGLLRIAHWPNTVMDLDDIPSRVYRSEAKAAVSPVRWLLDYRMSMIWRRRERKLPQRFSLLMVCSDDDRKYLRLDQVRVLPNGFEHPDPAERHLASPPCIGFIGDFRYAPNVDGVQWFCRSVWPLVRRHLPDVRFRVVGEGSGVVSGWGEGVEGLGRVADVGAEIASWTMMVVPIRIGGGTRIKVLEAFARQCPVVATTLGAFGYDLRDREELLLADQSDVFAARCIELTRAPQLGREMAARAYARFLRSWTWESYADIVGAAIRETAKRTCRSQA